MVPPFPPFQWPGYESWERQIQIRDQTRHRNEITLERFAKLVAGVVDRFLAVRLCPGFKAASYLIRYAKCPCVCSMAPRSSLKIPHGGWEMALSPAMM